MNRREFSKSALMLGIGGMVAGGTLERTYAHEKSKNFYKENAKNLPIRKADVVIAGGGTAGVVAALASARQGARGIPQTIIDNLMKVGGCSGHAEMNFYT